ncbi:hypothetical protein [Streptomyces sp. NPDC059398]|uniref:hypothetical protein n=1 Tax=Streptomyces sp. NPDC059398 TaxID=3346820 RepID=UPI0036AEC160
MIAIATAVAQIIVILLHRKRTYATARTTTTPWAYMAACMIACAAGWLIIGRPAIGWGDLFLTLMFGVLLGSETAKALEELSTRRWAAWTAACISGIGSATWLSQSPWPFT